MQKRRLWGWAESVLLAVLFASVGAGTALATTSSSTNYQVTDAQFGSGSTLESCSGKYCTQATIGDMAAGTSKSAKNTAEFGEITSGEPLLEVIIDQGESNLGVLETDKTATKTMTVRVRNYLSEGYILQIIGDPPKYDKHTLKASSEPIASRPGSEQFGINAVANTTPEVGADPKHVPSDQFSFGVVEPDYNTPNLFKFTSGDVIARSNSESGRTDYTISMIVNVSNATPAGHYSADFSAVVIPVY